MMIFLISNPFHTQVGVAGVKLKGPKRGPGMVLANKLNKLPIKIGEKRENLFLTLGTLYSVESTQT